MKIKITLAIAIASCMHLSCASNVSDSQAEAADYHYASISSYDRTTLYAHFVFDEHGNLWPGGDAGLSVNYCNPETGWLCFVGRLFTLAIPARSGKYPESWEFCDWKFESAEETTIKVFGFQSVVRPLVATKENEVVLYWLSADKGLLAFTLGAQKDFSNTYFLTSQNGVLSKSHASYLLSEESRNSLGSLLIEKLNIGENSIEADVAGCSRHSETP